jgi:O-antigen ligase
MDSNVFISLVAGIGILSILIAAFSWQRLIWAVLFLLVCEGAVRKFLPGLQAQLYLLKDAILICAYIKFLTVRGQSGHNGNVVNGLWFWFELILSYSALQLLNPNSPSMILTIIGFKNYMLYMPLAFLVPYLFTAGSDLETKLRKYALFMIPFAAVGLVQFAFGPDHWLNSTLSYDDDESLQQVVAQFGYDEYAKARTNGTFSYIGGYVTFLTIMFYLAIALMVSRKWKVQGNRLVIALLIVTLAAMFTTGSRTPFYGLVVTAPIVFGIWTVKGLISSQQLLRLVGLCVLVLVVVQFIAPAAIDAYQHRAAETSSDTTNRLLSPVTELYSSLQTTPIMGLGMGSAHGSSVSIMGTRDMWWLQGNMYELETARVLQETGVIGFILIYGCRFWLLLKAISLAMRFRTPLFVALSSVIAGFFFQSIYLFVVNNPTAGIYYWFSAGLLLAMCRLESQHSVVRKRNAAREMATLRG